MTHFAVPMMAASLLLGGCESVQFEGKAFELMGLGEKKKQQESKMPERAPLVVPPKRELPPPGPREQIANPADWPQDPNLAREQQIAAAKEQARKRCAEPGLKKNHIYEYEGHADPMANCKGMFGKTTAIDEENRGDGSPDKVVEHPDEMTASKKKKPAESTQPSAWRTDTAPTKPRN